jgi:cation transport regulator ChaB
MSRPEFPDRPIYGSERVLNLDQYWARTFNMYQSVVSELFSGIAPGKIGRMHLPDSFGRMWAMDISPRRSALYVRRYQRQSNTEGFKTDPKRMGGHKEEEKAFIVTWHSAKAKHTGGKDLEWMLQEAEAILTDILSTHNIQPAETKVA